MNAKLLSTIVVITILCTSFVGVVTTQEIEEPNEIAPVIIYGVIILAGMIGSGAVGWALNDYLTSNDADVQSHLRLAAANNITDVMSVATTFTANANANYAQLWGMTKEHWIRQAELEAYAQWDKGATYNGDSILLGAYAYENNATMTANAVAQIDSFLGEVTEKVAKWSADDNKSTYDGKMNIGFVLDNTQMLTDSNKIGADMISVFDTQGTSGKVYICMVDDSDVVTVSKTDDTNADYSPSYIYNFGSQTTITSDDGVSYVIKQGKNYLSDMRSTVGNKSFQSGIYKVSNALIGGDSLSSTLDTIKLKAGLAMTTNGSTTVAYLGDNDKIVCNGQKYDALSFLVDPEDIPSGKEKPNSVDIKSVLIAYQSLLDKLYWTSVSANSSASAVWNIYNTVDEKNYNVTTLMSSNVFDTVVLSEGMNQVLTLSAMQQLSTFYEKNGDDMKDLKIGLYSDSMNAPFVRGAILDEYGNTLYKDVIFTPFFQSESVTLNKISDHKVTQNTLVAIWAEGQELTEWYDAGAVAEGYQSVFIEDGYSIRATQLGECDSSGMRNVEEITFKVTKVDFIDPGKVNLIDDTDWEKVAKNILKIACIAIGAILALLGIVRRDPLYIIIGAGLLVFGLMFADTVWSWIVKLFKL